MPTTPHPVARLLEQAARRLPGELADVVADVAGDAWGARGAEVLLATYEQTELVPLGRPGRRHVTPVSDDEPAGCCFVTGAPVTGPTTWLPLTHRGERLGVLGLPGVTAPPEEMAGVADALALLLAASRGHDDAVEVARRTQEMAVGAELLTGLAPALSYADDRVSVAALVEPSYASGGDALDHAVDGDVLRVLIVDATGHGFLPSVTSAVAVAAFRSARRAGEDLLGTWTALERFVTDSGAGDADPRYATALVVELHLGTGRLSWVSAGHPSPVLLRADGETVVLDADPAPPLGTGLGGEPTPGHDYLEPGDVLALHTDGLTEARDLHGHMLGLDGYLRALRAEVGRPGSLAERLRRLRLDLLARDDAWMSDDATAVLVEWHGSALD